jgi:hypothetical protein
MIRARALSLLAAGALACACMPASALNEEEQRARIIYQADEATHVIDELDILYTDPVLDAYLQGIVDKLFPESGGKLVIRVFKATSFNAFAMSNGRLYIHTGTLLRLKDEAETGVGARPRGLARIRRPHLPFGELGEDHHADSHRARDGTGRGLARTARGSVVDHGHVARARTRSRQSMDSSVSQRRGMTRPVRLNPFAGCCASSTR